MALLRHEGEYWTFGFEGRLVRLRDTQGVRYLAELLRAPGERLHAGVLRATATGAAASLAPPGGVDATADRARLAVTKGIGKAVARIAGKHPELGRHLSATVRRGYFCSYVPDPRHPIRWGP